MLCTKLRVCYLVLKCCHQLHNFVMMNMLLNKCIYTSKITNLVTMQINQIHQSDDNQPVHSSMARRDKIRRRVDPTPFLLHHSGCSSSHHTTVHSTSLFPCWYIAACLYMTRHCGLQQNGNQHWKRHYTYLQKSYWYSSSSSRKTVYWMDCIYLVYIGYWQHYPEIESSSKLLSLSTGMDLWQQNV